MAVAFVHSFQSLHSSEEKEWPRRDTIALGNVATLQELGGDLAPR